MLIACFYLPEIGIAVENTRIPYYQGCPLALAGADGVLSAVSESAGRSGMAIGMTVTGARALCRELVILPYDRAAYEEAAEAVWDILATESSKVEPISPEMCFIEVSGMHSIASVQALSGLLAQHIGVRVRIGIGSSKLVAQQAARKEDDAPCVRVPLGMEAVFLASVPLSNLPSIPPTIRQRLTRLGVHTLGDVLRIPQLALTNQFKDVARKLQRLAVGEDGETVRPLWPPPTIEQEISFEEETAREVEIKAGIRACASSLASSLQRERTYCRKITMTLRLPEGSEIRLTEPLRAATNDAGEILAIGSRLLKRASLTSSITGIKMAAGGLGAGAGVQLTLLAENDQTREQEEARHRKLEETMHYVRKRFGVSAVVPASLFKTLRQVQLLVYPLGQRKRESVMVATSRDGIPQRFYRHRNCVRSKHEVVAVQDQWYQASWSWESILETHCYRVVTDPWGLHQLEQLGVEWTLTATAD